MSKKLGKLFTLAVTAGTAAAAAYYYLQNKKAAVQEAPEEEDDFEKDPEDDFDDTDFTDDDFVDESEHPEEAKEEAKEDTPVFSSETKEDGHTYVTLDLKAAQDKAVQLRLCTLGNLDRVRAGLLVDRQHQAFLAVDLGQRIAVLGLQRHIRNLV